MKTYFAGLIIGLVSLLPFNHHQPESIKPVTIMPAHPISVEPYLILPKAIPNPVDSCDEVRSLALDLGFDPITLPKVIKIINRESRCTESAINKTLNKDKSIDYGLAQINDRTWCKGSRFLGTGYLQSKKIINSCVDLLDAETNLLAMAELMRYSTGSTGCPFTPWRMCD